MWASDHFRLLPQPSPSSRPHHLLPAPQKWPLATPLLPVLLPPSSQHDGFTNVNQTTLLLCLKVARLALASEPWHCCFLLPEMLFLHVAPPPHFRVLGANLISAEKPSLTAPSQLEPSCPRQLLSVYFLPNTCQHLEFYIYLFVCLPRHTVRPWRTEMTSTCSLLNSYFRTVPDT